MFYPQEVVGEVVAMNDVLDVVMAYVPSLKPRSGNHFGLCPFHAEKTPSFSVNQERQIFYCFGCGAGGSVLTFIMRIENMDFVDALKLLADRVRYQLPEKGTSPHAKKQAAERELFAALNKRAALFFHEYLNADNADAIFAREYLKNRGVEAKLIKRFGLGLSEDAWGSLMTHLKDVAPHDIAAAGLASQSKKNAEQYYDRFRGRLMFPIIDSRSRVVGFGGRILKADEGDKKEAKYVNTPETVLFHKSDQLYGLNLARKAKTSELIIVEGYMDVLALHQAGFVNTVGVLGTALNDSHVRLLKRANCKAVVLVLDNDTAGINAALRAIPVLAKGEIKVKVLNVADAKDPDEYIQKFGANAFANQLAHAAKSHIAFRVSLLKEKFDLSNTDERVEFTQEAAKILSSLTSDIEIDVYVNEIARASGISPNAIYSEVNKQRGVVEMKGIPRNPQSLRPVVSVQERGLKDAKKGLLNIVLTHTSAARALAKSKFLQPDEMGEGIHAKLLILAFENAAKNNEQSPSDIINFFETFEEQQAVAEIFVTQPYYPSTEKALNDMANIIKRAWIKTQKMEANDLNTLKTLQLQEKNMAEQYITMSDG